MNRNIRHIPGRVIPAMLIASIFTALHASHKTHKPMDRFITRNGDRLMEGEKEFRFFGLAAPNLQANESQLRPDFSNRFPDEFEIRDSYGAIHQLGGRATRTFSLSVYHPDDKNVPVYISARRTYNEEAFRCLDRVIALAHEYDVRVIIPFIASQSFGTIRGVDEFALLSGKPGPFFWTDPEIREDFKHFLSFVLNRKNTVNGLQYKNDPAVLCWQLGNEFGSYPYDRRMNPEPWSRIILDWSLEMAAHIKTIDGNHLVMEAGGCDRDSLIADPNIDLISEHLYEYWNRMGGRPWELGPLAKRAMEQCRGRKPLIVDEFGLGSTDNLRELMRVIREEGISGGLMWSFRSHRRDGGWYYHNEGGTPVNSFHFPGFSAGFQYEEKRLLDLLRTEAFQIRGMSPPEIDKPSPAPILMRVKEGFTWRGSTGAACYTMERSDDRTGMWKVVAMGLDDSVIADAKSFEASPEASYPLVLWHDETAEKGKTYQYRIRGENVSGWTDYSTIVSVSY